MLSLRDILHLAVVRRGQPRVVAGAGGLDTPVRWVHAMELTGVGSLLRGGELVLSTGIALPDDPAGLQAYVRELAAAGVSGLAIELGRRYIAELPKPLVTAAENTGLPVVAFEHEIPFVEITEAVHSRIIDESLAELRAAETIHQAFTELSVAGAPAEQIVQAAARLADRPVILADLSHRVLACAATDVGEVLDGFADRARTAISTITTRTGLSGNWLITTVGARGEDWGRLFLCDGSAEPADTVLVERAATTLALGRLLTRQAESLERQAHRTLITTLLSTSQGDASEAEARARALGVPVTGRQLVSAVVRVPDSGPGLSAHVAVLAAAETVAQACRAASVPALVGSLDDVRAGALLSLPSDADANAVLDSVAGAVGAQLDGSFVIGAGPVVATLREARQSMIDAREVADVAFRDPDGRLWYRLPDLRLRGLLHLLRDDARLQAFAERELGALLSYDAGHGTELVATLSLFLSCGGNKAAAAQRAHLARPTFYQRLRLISRLLDVDLDDSESRTSLHVALLASVPDLT